MKSRQEIKALAKESVAQQRGTVIIIVFLLVLIGSATGLIGQIPFIGWLLSIALTFIIMALEVNMSGSFIKIYRREMITVGDPFSALSVNFFRKVGGMYWMALWVFLWSLLLVIPGIVKAFAYCLTPYILADCPNVTATNALKLSMRMTKGHKMDLFVLALSFIGWMILSALTFGILYFVYVGPYMYATFAGFYTQLRDKAIASGVVEQSELV